MVELDLQQDVACWALAATHRLTPDSRPILADLDGTLCDPDHRRHHLSSSPSDWVAFSMAAASDPPLLRSIRLLNALSVIKPVVIVSGRPSIALTLTQEWLHKHQVRWDAIALRPAGDTVPGVEHKIRVLAALRRLGIQPEFALDDSAQVREVFAVQRLPCVNPVQRRDIRYKEADPGGSESQS